MSSRNDKLIAAAADCVVKANICLQHCLDLLGQGDKSMAACAKSASQTAAICTALQQLAASGSKQLPQLPKWRWISAKSAKKNAEDRKNTRMQGLQEACQRVTGNARRLLLEPKHGFTFQSSAIILQCNDARLVRAFFRTMCKRNTTWLINRDSARNSPRREACCDGSGSRREAHQAGFQSRC